MSSEPRGTPATPSRQRMIDSAHEYMQILTACRDVLHQWQRYQRTGILKVDRKVLADEIGFIVLTARYAVKLWTREGAWPVYYMAPSGVVHDCLGCHAINPRHTRLQAMLDLAGKPVQAVDEAGRVLCKHCRARPHSQAVAMVERIVGRITCELEDVEKALREEESEQ